MVLRQRYQLGICYFIICIISVLSTVYVSTIDITNLFQFLSIGFGLVLSSFLLVLGVHYTFGKDMELDHTPLREEIKLKLPGYKGIISVVVIIVLGFIFFKPAKPMIHMYNTNVYYIYKLEKVMQERKMFYDKMWKTYLTKNDICQVNRETFIEVTNIIMNGRSDGQNVSWKFVKENQNIPYNEFTTFYKDLSKFVTEQRESYYQLENEAMKIVQQQNSMLDSFPNNMYNKILGIQKLHYTSGFTSARTEEVFKNHRE